MLPARAAGAQGPPKLPLGKPPARLARAGGLRRQGCMRQARVRGRGSARAVPGGRRCGGCRASRRGHIGAWRGQQRPRRPCGISAAWRRVARMRQGALQRRSVFPKGQLREARKGAVEISREPAQNWHAGAPESAGSMGVAGGKPGRAGNGRAGARAATGQMRRGAGGRAGAMRANPGTPPWAKKRNGPQRTTAPQGATRKGGRRAAMTREPARGSRAWCRTAARSTCARHGR